MKRILILFTFFFTFFTSALEVNIGVENSWPPYANEEGEGISTDIVVEAFREVGVKVNLHIYPYSRIMEMAKRGELDGCYNVARDQSTNAQFIFGDEPILETSVSYYYLKGKPFKKELLPKDKIALMRGYQYGDKFEENKKNYTQFRVNTQEQILKLIQRGRVDVGILAEGSADFQLKRLGLEDKVVKGGEHMTLEVYLAFTKKKSTSSNFSKLLDKGIRKLKEKGLYKSIMSGKRKGPNSLARNQDI